MSSRVDRIRFSGVVLGALVGCAVLLASVLPAAGQQAAKKKRPGLTDFQIRVNKAIQRGADYLRRQQGADGGFGTSKLRTKPGNSALCVLALRKSGADRKDPTIRRALPFLLRYAGQHSRLADKHAVYNCGAALLAFDSLGGEVEKYGKKVHKPYSRRALQKLGGTVVAMQAADGGWGYKPRESHDLSNTQYALLGLWAASRNGIQVPRQVWLKAERYVLSLRHVNGGWVYSRNKKYSPTRSMTAAGIGCLAICYLQVKGQRLNRQDVAGEYLINLTEPGKAEAKKRKKGNRVTKAELAIEAGFKWFGARGLTELDPYYMYGLERACALTKTQTIGGEDWYKRLAGEIVSVQRGDGSWVMSSVGNKNDPILSTCWSLLVLARSTEQMFGEYPQGDEGYYESELPEATTPAAVPGTKQPGNGAKTPEAATPPAVKEGSGAKTGGTSVELPDQARVATRVDELKILKGYIDQTKLSLAEKLIDAMLASGGDADTQAARLKKIKAHVVLGDKPSALTVVRALLEAEGVEMDEDDPDTGAPANAKKAPPKKLPPKRMPTVANPAAAKLKMAKNYLKIGRKERAERYLSDIIEKWPNSKEAKEARKLLGAL